MKQPSVPLHPPTPGLCPELPGSETSHPAGHSTLTRVAGAGQQGSAGQGQGSACKRREHCHSGLGDLSLLRSEADAQCSGVCRGPQHWPCPGTSRLAALSHLSAHSPRLVLLPSARSRRGHRGSESEALAWPQAGICGKELGPTSGHPGPMPAWCLLAAYRCEHAKGPSRHRERGETPPGKVSPFQRAWVHPGQAPPV